MDSPRFGSPSSGAVSVSFSDTWMGSRSVCVTPRPVFNTQAGARSSGVPRGSLHFTQRVVL